MERGKANHLAYTRERMYFRILTRSYSDYYINLIALDLMAREMNVVLERIFGSTPLALIY